MSNTSQTSNSGSWYLYCWKARSHNFLLLNPNSASTGRQSISELHLIQVQATRVCFVAQMQAHPALKPYFRPLKSRNSRFEPRLPLGTQGAACSEPDIWHSAAPIWLKLVCILVLFGGAAGLFGYLWTIVGVGNSASITTIMYPIDSDRHGYVGREDLSPFPLGVYIITPGQSFQSCTAFSSFSAPSLLSKEASSLVHHIR